ncbi:hypothetical protein [Vulcanisaeta distributa]|uniref:hypothetical protein n=1 Tax=Vulcanisaeta distributa TaxID=164451 RepID=UPI001FB27000|nr:hypothetical protein [Vulcanisaeta distributa]
MNKIYWGGIKVKGNRRLIPGELVDNITRKEALKLINEFLNKVEKYRDILLSDSRTPFDRYIIALDEFINNLEFKLGENGNQSIVEKGSNHYSNEANKDLTKVIIETKKSMVRIAESMLGLLKRVRKRWLRVGKHELEQLINELIRGGEARILVSGEPNKENKSFAVHLYTRHIAITISRKANGSRTIALTLTKLKGIHITIPKLFDDIILNAMEYGLLLTDGTIDRAGYPRMNTHNLWQAIIWILSYPGKVHIYVSGISINDDNVSVAWVLTTMNHGVKNKKEVVERAIKFSDDDF